MKVKVLGTAACEGVPAMFCNCENCVKVRELKGKNLRARTQTLIESDMLVDFNADTYLNGQPRVVYFELHRLKEMVLISYNKFPFCNCSARFYLIIS